ncbi:MAG: hypothetical protein M3Y48_09715 [Actinomycetota bacterium]|nr:hypothetical protein [Actinomycetota bacterium]
MTLLRPGTPHTVGAGHDLETPLLAAGPQVQVVLQQTARQLPATLGELILKLSMSHLTATRIGKPRHDLLEQLPRPVKRPRHALRLLRLPRPGLLRVP